MGHTTPRVIAALATLIMVSGTTIALADDDNTDPTTSSDKFGQPDQSSATLDLGIDVNAVPITPNGVNRVLGSLSPSGQQILLDSCSHYLANPTEAQQQRTLQFCDMLLGG